MKFEEIESHLRGIPHTPSEDGKVLYNFVLENKITNILELGFQHGVSTNYFAAALDELGSGKILTIDREIARNENPNINELSKKTALDKYIEVIFANTSYIWELRKLIKHNIENPDKAKLFDFCFIDGAHSFETDGFAFLLVDKLLNDGGIILFDDINWSYASSPTLKDTDFVKQMSNEERNAEQINDVIELLVATNPNYEILEIRNRWAWVQKKSNTDSTSNISSLYKKQSKAYQIKQLLRSILK
jgi:predicted O-methyltransferase YrrM